MPESHGPDLVSVVVPAHDEELLLARCLTAVGASVAALRLARPRVRVRTVVVLDACTDRSAEVAARFDVEVVVTGARSVGAARRVGVGHAALRARSLPPSRHWVACTDADSVVPVDWLTAQVAAAREGARLVLGGVRPDPLDLPAALLLAWQRTADHADVAVHGANLGVRLDAYLGAGGFPPASEHEDVALVRALELGGVRPRRGRPVLTSGRTDGRTPGGFAGYLRELAEPAAGGSPGVPPSP